MQSNHKRNSSIFRLFTLFGKESRDLEKQIGRELKYIHLVNEKYPPQITISITSYFNCFVWPFDYDRFEKVLSRAYMIQKHNTKSPLLATNYFRFMLITGAQTDTDTYKSAKTDQPLETRIFGIRGPPCRKKKMQKLNFRIFLQKRCFLYYALIRENKNTASAIIRKFNYERCVCWRKSVV